MVVLWTWRTVDAPAHAAWSVLSHLERWPDWGPSVRSVEPPSGQVEPDLRGTVVSAVGVRLPFRITSVEPGRRWRWSVAGIGATDHRVEPLGPHRCLVGIGVPWWASPYLAVCRVGLARLAAVAHDQVGPDR